jgi:hypothetical protein
MSDGMIQRFVVERDEERLPRDGFPRDDGAEQVRVPEEDSLKAVAGGDAEGHRKGDGSGQDRVEEEDSKGAETKDEEVSDRPNKKKS